MSIEIGFTNDESNTQYAPLAVLSAYYRHKNLLLPLQEMNSWQKKDFFSARKANSGLFEHFSRLCHANRSQLKDTS